MTLRKNQKLVKEDRWSRVFKERDDVLTFKSKFDTDGLSILLNELESEWKTWDQGEKLSFVSAFTRKPEFSTDDEFILEFLMKEGDGETWTMLALSLRFHSNKKMVVQFLTERVNSVTCSPKFSPAKT